NNHLMSISWNGITLTLDASDTFNGGNNDHIQAYLYSLHGVTAGVGDIVVHYSQNGGAEAMALTAVQVDGLAAPSALDRTAVGHGSSGAASVGPTSVTTRDDEYFAAVLMTQGPVED